MSVLMWKALHGCLPVDDRLRRVGIIIVTDLVSGLSSFRHAKFDWKNWKERMECWFRRAKRSSCSGQILGLLPIIITWRLWWRRCKARIEGTLDFIDTVWLSIKYWLSWVGFKFKDQNNISKRDAELLHYLNLPIPSARMRGDKIVRWEKPQLGWYKLNVDGCSLGNPGASGVGGVIRDHDDELRLGFSAPIGCCSNNHAEVMGLLYGLRHARHLGCDAIELEMDSKLIIDWIGDGQCGLWYLEDYWEEIMSFFGQIHFTFRHIYRECNAVADILAKSGAKGSHLTYSSALELTRTARRFFRLDKGGLPYLRRP